MKNKTQQTTGWLDNLNDSKVSLPQGFVGEGTINGPQWNNGAWGGQFASGGGLSRSKDYGSKGHPYPSVSQSDFAGPHRSYPIPTEADAHDAEYLAKIHHKPDVLAKIRAKYPNLHKGQSGTDMYGNPITARETYESGMGRSQYEPRTNSMRLDKNLLFDPDTLNKVKAHENFHAWQFGNDRTNYNMVHNPDYAFQDRLQKRPEMMSTDDVFHNYHDRKVKEVGKDIHDFKQTNPQFSFVPDDMVFNQWIDQAQYTNPNSMEGEAELYENTGQYPKGQDGKKVSPKMKEFLKSIPKQSTYRENMDAMRKQQEEGSEALRRYTNTKEYQEAKKQDKANIIKERKERIKKADVNPLNQWSAEAINPKNWTRENLAEASAAIGDKARWFPEDPDSVIDEYLNPGVMIGNMASDLGSAPLRAKQEDSYMPYATSIGVPLVTGALEGIGTGGSNRKFASNVLNPLNMVPGYNTLEKKIASGFRPKTEFVPQMLEPIPPSEIPTINLGQRDRVSKALQPKRWERTVLDNGLIEAKPLNPRSHEADIVMRVGHPEKGEIALKTYKGEGGEDLFHFSASMPESSLTAGRAFKHLEDAVPKGGKILERESLSTDSFHNVLRRAENPKKFEWSHDGHSYIPLNTSGKNKALSNADKTIEGYRTTIFRDEKEAQKALDEINSRIKIEGMPKARMVKKIDKEKLIGLGPKDPMPRMYQIEVPSIGLTKMYKQGGIIDDEMGQWAHPGEVTRIPSNNITMKDVPYNVLGISDEGDMKMMSPGEDYKFKGSSVTEYPQAQNGSTPIRLGNNPISSLYEDFTINRNDKAEIQKQQDFVDNWYQNRVVYPEGKDPVSIKYPNIPSERKPIYTVTGDSMKGKLGEYNTEENEIKFHRGFDFVEEGTPAHEYDHFYQADPKMGFLRGKGKTGSIGDKYVREPWLKGMKQNVNNIKKEDIDYYLSMPEVHSRLMEIRYLNNLKPNQKITPEQAKKLNIPGNSSYLKDALKAKGYGLDWFLNNLVQNEDTQMGTTQVAQNGVELNQLTNFANKKQSGGWLDNL